ncbi:MAG: N-acetylmuramoyl-L-alanine amidase family protein [Bacillota bacterium]|nr:N-acetylmuramoyl-L-alanine amidase family protein [Bacillota bacterium]
MKKSLSLVLLLLALILTIPSRAYASPGSAFNVKIDGKETKVYDVNLKLGDQKVSTEFKPYIHKDRTFVPVRLVAESFDSQVEWKEDTKTAIITKDSDLIVLTIGKSEAIKSGELISLPADQVPGLVDYLNGQAKTMVPLRLISELLGYQVDWDGDQRLVTIKQGPSQAQNPNNNQIKTIEKINGSSKNEQIKITASQTLDYSYRFEEEKNSLLLTIKNASLNIDSQEAGQMTIDGKIVDSVEYSTDQKTLTSTIRIQLKRFAKPDIKSLDQGKALKVSFTNEITGLRPIIYQGQEAVLIENVQSSEYNVIKLKDPFRYVIDIKDASLLADKKAAKFDIETGFISGIRANQFIPDQNYSENDNIVRIVLDSKAGINEGHVQIEKKDFDLILIPQEGPSNGQNLTDPDLVPSNPLGSGDKVDQEGYFDGVEEVEVIERKPRIQPNSIEEVVIVLDPGHGGSQPGACADDGTEEKDLNLDIGLRAERILTAYGYTVEMTRYTDQTVNTYDRPKIANDKDAHAFVSIHANSSTNSQASGLETLYAPRDTTSVKYDPQYPLAQKIHYELVKETAMTSRGIKQRPDLIVLNQSQMSAVLVELGFMSNASDLTIMKTEEFKDACALAIANGIISYIQETYGY